MHAFVLELEVGEEVLDHEQLLTLIDTLLIELIPDIHFEALRQFTPQVLLVLQRLLQLCFCVDFPFLCLNECLDYRGGIHTELGVFMACGFFFVGGLEGSLGGGGF